MKTDRDAAAASMLIISVSCDTDSPREDKRIRWSLQDLDGAAGERGEVRTRPDFVL